MDVLKKKNWDTDNLLTSYDLSTCGSQDLDLIVRQLGFHNEIKAFLLMVKHNIVIRRRENIICAENDCTEICWNYRTGDDVADTIRIIGDAAKVIEG